MAYFITRCDQCQHLHLAIPASDETAGYEYWLRHAITFCEQNGIEIGHDGSVYEEEAADIIDRSRYTLRNWRLTNNPLQSFKHQGRAKVHLTVIARFLDQTRPIGEAY